MQKQSIKLINKLGLHARASMKLMNAASRFQSDLFIHHNGRKSDAKDIMTLMALAITVGTEIEIEADGPDEKDALKAVIHLINDRFGESE